MNALLKKSVTKEQYSYIYGFMNAVATIFDKNRGTRKLELGYGFSQQHRKLRRDVLVIAINLPTDQHKDFLQQLNEKQAENPAKNMAKISENDIKAASSKRLVEFIRRHAEQYKK